jgi:EpsI family protein
VLRFSVAIALIACTAVFLRVRNSNEVFPPRAALAAFPLQIGPWNGTDNPIGSDIIQALGPGDFLLRRYQLNNKTEPPVYVYIAYFPSQRAGDTIHSPKNCLPGAGWTPIDSTRLTLSFPEHLPFPVTRYTIAKGDSRQVMFYWYWAHNRGLASEYWAKFYLVADSIRMNRSDGALVRISTEMYTGETAANAEQRLYSFAAQVVDRLGAYIPN